MREGKVGDKKRHKKTHSDQLKKSQSVLQNTPNPISLLLQVSLLPFSTSKPKFWSVHTAVSKQFGDDSIRKAFFDSLRYNTVAERSQRKQNNFDRAGNTYQYRPT